MSSMKMNSNTRQVRNKAYDLQQAGWPDHPPLPEVRHAIISVVFNRNVFFDVQLEFKDELKL